MPNVTYNIDPSTESIRYTTTRQIEPDEELCIFYGNKLWFNPVDCANCTSDDVSGAEDGWGGLISIDDQNETVSGDDDCVLDGDPNEIILEEDLPFTRIKLAPEEDEEEDMESIRTVQAWVIDIPDLRHTTTMLKWLKTSALDTPALAHLKRIRKSPTHSTLLLSTSPSVPMLPSDPDLGLSEPYMLPIPRTAAITQTSLMLKNALWPTMFAPRRKYEPEQWSRAKVRWAQRAMRFVVREARKARDAGEVRFLFALFALDKSLAIRSTDAWMIGLQLPIVSHVPAPFDDPDSTHPGPSFTSHDTRTSASHPLRHSVLNVIRQVADHRNSILSSPPMEENVIPIAGGVPTPSPGPEIRNGQHYLLTSLTLFTTHEPCIMCSMALLHSRVKEVFYLIPMQKTGGCGGVACLPKLEGVNHRFGIGKWKVGSDGDQLGDHLKELQVGEDVDA
ncbi:hypothetical protein EW146_g9497 [Bondarzewia mesenterica]|uniref:CMP/dCMP-type deaminase domain-containing protein n=1 Tax=Bondarzewia mesenterica TaxID=1095465 RepID=A0A4S4L5P2_9AGAM|nr:hypothetical protein EW146_g9497 [Bondarzewia mesenterica]